MADKPVTGRRATKPRKAPRAGGRPTAYKAEFVEQARKLCDKGFIDQEIADFFGVDRITLHRWRARYPDLAEAMALGKDVANSRVERSLLSKALGYSYASEKIFCHDGQVIRVPTVEHVPPSDTACIIWLKNRDRDNWRDKQEHEHTGKGGGPIEYANMTDEEVDARISAILAASEPDKAPA